MQGVKHVSWLLLKLVSEKQRHDSAGSIDGDVCSQTQGWTTHWSRAISSSRFPLCLSPSPSPLHLCFSHSLTRQPSLSFNEVNKNISSVSSSPSTTVPHLTQVWCCWICYFLIISWRSPGKKQLQGKLRQSFETVIYVSPCFHKVVDFQIIQDLDKHIMPQLNTLYFTST